MARPGVTGGNDKARALALYPVSREIQERLDRYAAFLDAWQKKTNLVGDSTLHTVWTRHFVDSLQILRQAADAKVWVDLGSGAGFPGLVVACAIADVPGAVVHLVESNGKKAAFLREAIRQTGAPAKVHAVRIEDFCAGFEGPVDVVCARALAPLSMLMTLAEPLLIKGAKALFLKGQDVDIELTEAAKYWTMEVHIVPSITSDTGCVLVLDKAQRR